jgi:hypothetical protein
MISNTIQTLNGIAIITRRIRSKEFRVVEGVKGIILEEEVGGKLLEEGEVAIAISIAIPIAILPAWIILRGGIQDGWAGMYCDKAFQGQDSNL